MRTGGFSMKFAPGLEGCSSRFSPRFQAVVRIEPSDRQEHMHVPAGVPTGQELSMKEEERAQEKRV